MTEYDSRVERQRLLLEAEVWADTPKALHTHRLSSMWYDDRPQDTEDSHVTDIEYNSGLIVRSKNGTEIHTFGKRLEGDKLIDKYCQSRA